MRILVTNDDGIDSIGLHVLARRLAELGEVVVAAPDREYSGAAAALGGPWRSRWSGPVNILNYMPKYLRARRTHFLPRCANLSFWAVAPSRLLLRVVKIRIQSPACRGLFFVWPAQA